MGGTLAFPVAPGAAGAVPPASGGETVLLEKPFRSETLPRRIREVLD
ncbi:MAG: hypothetical protein HY722_09830 [Planctomycetes bacterium]|nr:hypothetical protein [Planctomycetota bacterium]